MKAVFSLVEYHRLRPVDNIVGDFVAPMGRQAMHEYGPGLCFFHQAGVDLVGLEQIVPALSAAIPHRHPGVGYHTVGVGDGALSFLPDANVGTRGFDPVEQRLLRREFRGCRNREFELELACRMHPRCEHVVAVSSPRHFTAPDRAAVLLEGHHVRHDLTRVGAPRQPVDHRNGGVARKFDQHVVIERADHDGINIARQHACRGGDRLSAAELHFLAGQHRGLAAKLAHCHIERHPGTGRRLVEDHCQHLTGDCLVGRATPALFHGAAVLDNGTKVARRNIDQIEKMTRPRAHEFTSTASLPASCFSRCARSIRSAARSIRLIASAISGSSMISGGSIRTTLSPAATARRFSARIASTNSPFGHAATRPSSRPSPRTSVMTAGWRSLISASRWRNRIALRRTLSRNPGARTTSSTALPKAIANGLAPTVEPWVPAVIPLPASAVARQAPSGNPPPIDLAMPMTSGATPQRW